MSEYTFKEQSARFWEIVAVLKKHKIMKGLTPQKARAVLEDLGPTYIKLGQILSLHSDILPKEYCKELETLRSDAAPMPFEEVKDILSDTYGRPVEELFSYIDERALGSASIAQVHRARLKDGMDVVIKVQRRGIYETMSQDMALLHKGAKFLKYNSNFGAVDFGQVIDEMWAVALEEMNFQKESSNILEFARCNENVKYFECPRLVPELTTSHALVMEYVDGYSLDKDRKTLIAKGYDLTEIGYKFADNYLKQILNDGFFHADPHPGNLRIRDGKIVWLDMGMMGRISARDRDIIDNIIRGISNRDINQIKDNLLSMCEIRGRVDHHRLYLDIDDIVTKYASAILGDIKVSAVINDLFEAIGRNNIRIPANLTMLVRGLATIEGVVAALDPEIDVMSVVRARAKSRFWETFDLQKEIKNSSKVIHNSFRKALEIPGVSSDILRMIMKGQTRFSLEHHVAKDFDKLLRKLVMDLVIGLVVAALLVGSSIICLTDMELKLFGIPVLGFVGYLVAFGLALWLIFRYLKSIKDKRK